MSVLCNDCPRKCNADRKENRTGYCGASDNIKIARAALHFWEEPCISAKQGSGAVFFSGCNLGCVFCQNHEISRGQKGKEVTAAELSDIFLKLQEQGANNINLVTPTHYVRQIIAALGLAKANGLKIPIVYNTGSYEKVETLKLLEGFVDVYLPDCKYYQEDKAMRYSFAPRYFEFARDAIIEMHRQVGKNVFDDNGIMQKGVIIRHMILPGNTKDSQLILRELYRIFGDDVYFSIMSQYTPVNGCDIEKYPELERKITKREYEKVVNYAIDLGIKNAFIQEGDVASESFIPDWE